MYIGAYNIVRMESLVYVYNDVMKVIDKLYYYTR